MTMDCEGSTNQTILFVLVFNLTVHLRWLLKIIIDSPLILIIFSNQFPFLFESLIFVNQLIDNK